MHLNFNIFMKTKTQKHIMAKVPHSQHEIHNNKKDFLIITNAL